MFARKKKIKISYLGEEEQTHGSSGWGWGQVKSRSMLHNPKQQPRNSAIHSPYTSAAHASTNSSSLIYKAKSQQAQRPIWSTQAHECRQTTSQSQAHKLLPISTCTCAESKVVASRSLDMRRVTIIHF